MEKCEAERREDERLGLRVSLLSRPLSRRVSLFPRSAQGRRARKALHVILGSSSAVVSHAQRGLGLQPGPCCFKILPVCHLAAFCLSLRSESRENLAVLTRKLQSIKDIDELTKMVSVNRHKVTDMEQHSCAVGN